MNDPSAAIRCLKVLAVFSVASSCAPSDEYDTPAPYQHQYGNHEGNPIYDSPPAYGDGAAESTGGASSAGPAPGLPADPGLAVDPGLPVDPGLAVPVSPPPTRSDERPGTVHTVVPGDTLSGISRRYGVSMDSIRRANQMTGDVVVLGRKMIIPSR